MCSFFCLCYLGACLYLFLLKEFQLLDLLILLILCFLTKFCFYEFLLVSFPLLCFTSFCFLFLICLHSQFDFWCWGYSMFSNFLQYCFSHIPLFQCMGVYRGWGDNPGLILRNTVTQELLSSRIFSFFFFFFISRLRTLTVLNSLQLILQCIATRECSQYHLHYFKLTFLFGLYDQFLSHCMYTQKESIFSIIWAYSWIPTRFILLLHYLSLLHFNSLLVHVPC